MRADVVRVYPRSVVDRMSGKNEWGTEGGNSELEKGRKVQLSLDDLDNRGQSNYGKNECGQLHLRVWLSAFG